MTQSDDEVPRLPRGRGIKLDAPMMMRIGFTLALLIMVGLTMKPCANAASRFVMGFEVEGSGSAPGVSVPKPGTVDVVEPAMTGSDYEPIRSDMTEAEVRAAIERAKQRARAQQSGTGMGTGTGTGSDSGSGSGSATAP